MKARLVMRILIGCSAAWSIFLAGCHSPIKMSPEAGGFSGAKSAGSALLYLLTLNPEDPAANRLVVDVLKRGEIPYELDAGVLNTVLINSKNLIEAQSALLSEKRLVLYSEDGCLTVAISPTKVSNPVSSIAEWNSLLLR